MIATIFMVFVGHTVYGQKQGEEFAIYGIRYKIAQTVIRGIAAYPELYRPGVVTVVGYTGSAKEVPIPAEVGYQAGSYLVTEIGDNAFKAKGLTRVTIPYSVTTIGHQAFSNNLLQGHLDIPNSVTTLGHQAFSNNRLQGHLVIPNSVTSIGYTAFMNNQLDSVVISNSMARIDPHVFRDNNLTSVTIPNSVTRIDRSAFAHNNLTEVTMANSVTSIGVNAFWHNQLTHVTIPYGVTSIGEQAFRDNPNLALVTVKANDPPTLHAAAFINPGRDQIDLVVPRGTTQAYVAHNDWTGFNSITEAAGIGDTFSIDHITYRVTSIGPNPNTVTAIGYDTAGGPNVTIPLTVSHQGVDYAVTIIGGEAFKRKGLTSVTIPETVTGIWRNAFAYNELTEVTIPDEVTIIGGRAFENNHQLTSVSIGKKVAKIQYFAFRNNYSLTSLLLQTDTPPTK